MGDYDEDAERIESDYVPAEYESQAQIQDFLEGEFPGEFAAEIAPKIEEIRSNDGQTEPSGNHPSGADDYYDPNEGDWK